MSDRLEKEIKRLSNLVTSKGKSDEEITKMAKMNLILKDFRSQPLFSYDGADETTKKKFDEEQAIAEERFKSYIENYNIESDADIYTLRSLIFLELQERRLQIEINKVSSEGKGSNKYNTEQILQIQEQIGDLRIKLGIDKEKKEDSQLTKLEQLEKRFEDYIEENRTEFTLDVPMICESCGHTAKYAYLLRKRVKDFDTIKHPWFVGRWFFNLSVIKFVKQGILTKEQAAEILSNASENLESQSAFSKEYCADMIDYMLEHWGEITAINQPLK